MSLTSSSSSAASQQGQIHSDKGRRCARTGKSSAQLLADRTARSAARAAKRKRDALVAQQGRVESGPRAAAPRASVKTITLERPCNVWGQIVVPSTLCGLLERRVVAVGNGDPKHVLRPDTR